MTPFTKIELLYMALGLAGFALAIYFELNHVHAFTKNPEDAEE
jgi:hypothetical protein